MMIWRQVFEVVSERTEISDVRLTEAERQVLADRVLGGAEPSPLMIRAVEAILAARLAAVEALADKWAAGTNVDYVRSRELRAALTAAQPPARSEGSGGEEGES